MRLLSTPRRWLLADVQRAATGILLSSPLKLQVGLAEPLVLLLLLSPLPWQLLSPPACRAIPDVL